MPKQPYKRDAGGTRFLFHGMNIVRPPDDMPPGKYPYAQNVRAYRHDAVTSRATQDSSVETLPAAVHSLRRLNDTTPAGPPSGFCLVGAAADELFANSNLVAAGLSGNPVSMVPFRPNQSVQPWMYIGDSRQSGVIIDSTATPNGMLKVRSDGLTYAMGIAEPQNRPTVQAVAASNVVASVGPVTVTYWGDSPHDGPTGDYIWKNAGDTSGAGPVRSATPPAGVTTGNSFLFDTMGGGGNPASPMQWTQYTIFQGTVNTAGTAVTWVSGDQFGTLTGGQVILINSVAYLILSVGGVTNLTLTSTAGTQTAVDYSAAAITGAVPLFTPALESEGYSDFNFALTATLYIPAAGSYSFKLNSKDEFIWGIGGTGTGTVTEGSTTGNTKAGYNQSRTALNGYPLLKKVITPDGGGQLDSVTASISFSQPGNYPIEIDYDYWYHGGRTLQMTVNGGNVPPLAGASVITGAQYRYRYRSSATGAVSNPSPPSPQENQSVLSNTVSATPSTDPQVDKIDYYRLDNGVLQYTYVGTGPNTNAPFTDDLLDTDIAANPVLEFDNFQPFPSIDLPRKGTVEVANGGNTVIWSSGDLFNVRWLPGTIIIIGTVAYTLVNRPTSTIHLQAARTEIIGTQEIFVFPPDGRGLTYEIAEPILAAEALPYLWGPTDNVAFMFACGDPIRPGVLYWTKGNNPDSAPDTNQQDVTSPSEPLVNGCIVNGIGLVMTPERGFLIYPNFFNALATVTGTVGATWTLQESISTRGLYMPRCIAVDGGGNVFFRAKDGVMLSPGGQGAKSITDDDLFNLFPHEGFTPIPVTRGGYTIYPPDDSLPQTQKMNIANGYLYYDYVATVDGISTPQTLVFDIAAKGWVVDSYFWPATLHILEEGPTINGVLTGCADGSVRPLTDSSSELGCSVLLMPCFNAGDTRAQKRFGDLYIEAGSRTS